MYLTTPIITIIQTFRPRLPRLSLAVVAPFYVLSQKTKIREKHNLDFALFTYSVATLVSLLQLSSLPRASRALDLLLLDACAPQGSQSTKSAYEVIASVVIDLPGQIR